MKKIDAINHFGSATKLARAVGISPSAVTQWGELVPRATASDLEKITGGSLVYDPAIYRRNGSRLWGTAEDLPPMTAGQDAA